MFAALTAASACSPERGLPSNAEAKPMERTTNGEAPAESMGSGDYKISIVAPFRLEITPSLAQRDKGECAAWKYNEANLPIDLDKMREADVGEWGRTCYQYACSLKGNAVINGHAYSVEINAGGWIFLSEHAHDPGRFFISESLRQGFLATCNCCATERAN